MLTSTQELALNQSLNQPPKNQILIFLHIFQLHFNKNSIYDYFLFFSLFLLNLKTKEIMINRILCHILEEIILKNEKENYNFNEKNMLDENASYFLTELVAICFNIKKFFNKKTIICDNINFIKFLENLCKKFYYAEIKNEQFNTMNQFNIIEESNINNQIFLKCHVCGNDTWNGKQIPLIIDPNYVNCDNNTFIPKYICLNCLIT